MKIKLISIYVSGMIISLFVGIYGDSVFASGTVNNISSATIFYHAWCCLLFGIMLIFGTKDLWLNLMGVKGEPEKSPNDRAGLLLTQICGLWVMAYAFVSFGIIFFVPNAIWALFILHIVSIFAQGGEVIVKVISSKKFGFGPIINTHHVIIQLIGLLFFLVTYYSL
ncbi:MAG: hypothetical protein COB73_09865 [Flavobacteriaceae bacterium]|nr:MAG: hypothetical protein COB73_09865 [Flavobacteriaceae bacterium]